MTWGALAAASLAVPLWLAAPSAAPQATAQGQQGQQGQGRGQGGGGRGQVRDVGEAPVGTAVIAGYVVAEGAGTPVRRARVSLSGAGLRGGRSTTTTDDGRFSFTALPAGRYTMTASKAGYVDIAYGAKRAGRPGTPIQLIDGQKIDKAVINLPKGAVITGIVVDDNAEPSPNTPVRAYRFVIRTGERTLQQAGSDTTDDRGMYRIFGLQPGDYIVNAVPRNLNTGDLRQTLQAEIEAVMRMLQQQAVAGGDAGGRGGGGGRGGRGIDLGPLLGGGRGGGALGDRLGQLQEQLQQAEEQTVAYAPVFYPGTTMPSGASSVSLAAGDERGGVDFQLQLVQTARIQGSVVGPDGSVPPGTQVGLVPVDPGGMSNVPGTSVNMARANQTGQFSFSNIPPGQYRLTARAPVRQAPPEGQVVVDISAGGRGGRGGEQGGRGRGGQGGQIVQVLWASNDISVNGQNMSDLVLTLQPGMSVTGRVQFEGSSAQPPTDLSRVRVNLTPRGQQLFDLGGGAPPAQVDASGRFTITGVIPGRYAINANVPGAGRGGGGAPAAPTGQPAPSWRLKSAVAAGRDALDFPLTIEPNQEVAGVLLTFTDRTQEVSGTIQDTMGRPTADFTIIVFPGDNRYWTPQSRRILSTRPGTDGRFTFRDLPAGDYRLTAVTDVEPGEWFNPEFLQQLIGVSIPVTLQEGERKVQDIRVAGG
jgi:hypothetical protein